jgi:hypothetical protein
MRRSEARHPARPSRTERGGGVPASERVGESEGRSPSGWEIEGEID